MALEYLTEMEILRGIFALIFVIISLVVGFKILLKYYATRNKSFISFGLTWIFMSSAWWRSAFSFLITLILNSYTELFLLLVVGQAFVPVALVCWIYSFSTLTLHGEKSKKWILIGVYGAICVIYDVILIYILFTKPEILILSLEKFRVKYTIFGSIFLIFAVATALITGIIFVKNSLKMDDKEVQWRAKFLLAAFISFSVGGFLEIIPLNPFTLILVRILLISSAIEYYLGFFLPNRLAKWLIKSKE